MMNKWSVFIFTFISLVVAILRFNLGDWSPMAVNIYKSMVHIYIGGFIGYWRGTRNSYFGYSVLILSILEVIAFFISR